MESVSATAASASEVPLESLLVKRFPPHVDASCFVAGTQTSALNSAAVQVISAQSLSKHSSGTVFMSCFEAAVSTDAHWGVLAVTAGTSAVSGRSRMLHI